MPNFAKSIDQLIKQNLDYSLSDTYLLNLCDHKVKAMACLNHKEKLSCYNKQNEIQVTGLVLLNNRSVWKLRFRSGCAVTIFNIQPKEVM